MKEDLNDQTQGTNKSLENMLDLMHNKPPKAKS